MGIPTWKEKLEDKMPPQLAAEIEDFEMQIALRKQGKIEEKVFAETRLRRGAYGQRYDNGHRYDGIKTQDLAFSSLTKGPETFWDAPGMLRIKLPFGGVNPEQMEVLAEVAEEYADAIVHITTRQDVQLHFVHIEDMPSLFRRLASVGITTREACGNSVRNVTACPLAGVCHTETFDVTPYAKALAYYLLGHPDTQDFGRKFKIAFSGCKQEACALVSIHDMGGIAATREIDGKTVRGFELYVGGGLGAVPHQAKLFAEFTPVEELGPIARAIGRVFARLGEKRQRNKARVKFLVHKLGIDEFRRLVLEERASMPEDPTWQRFFDDIDEYDEQPTFKGVQLNGARRPEGFEEWSASNIYPQRQPGYATVTVTLPLGDLTSDQMRSLAAITRKYAGEHSRTTIEQNMVLRWVPQNKVIDLYQELRAVGLGLAGAGTIVDVTACPGTDTCKLGIASSRGLAGELRTRLAQKSLAADEGVRHLRIKVSGCFNSCGQHHVADLGFYGNNRTINNFNVPHFQVMIGGMWAENGGSYGLAIGSIPSKRIPDVVDRITGRFIAERQPGDTFHSWCTRIGKKALKDMLNDLSSVPSHDVDPSFYTDWGDPREYSIGDMGIGECAGEVVSLTQFGFAQAEGQIFQAQILLDAGDYQRADQTAYQAMLTLAKTLVQTQWQDVPTDPNTIIEEFRTRLVDTKLFWDQYHHNQFSAYLFSRHEGPDTRYTQDSAHKLVEEAYLFLDAAHKCNSKLQAAQNAPAAAAASA